MKKFAFTIFVLLSCTVIHAQENSVSNKVYGKIQNDGSLKRKVSDKPSNTYLSSVLHNMNISGTINKSEIIYLQDKGYWVLQGEGFSAGNSGSTRNIRIQLEADGGGNLRIAAAGTTESCTGNPCAECAFAAGGGCVCKRTSSSQVGIDGKCDHTISKTSKAIKSDAVVPKNK